MAHIAWEDFLTANAEKLAAGQSRSTGGLGFRV